MWPDRGNRCDWCPYPWILAYVADEVVLGQACVNHRDRLITWASSGLGTYVGRSVGA